MMDKLLNQKNQVEQMLGQITYINQELTKNLTKTKVDYVIYFARNVVNFEKNGSNLDGIRYGGALLFIDTRNFARNVENFYQILNSNKPKLLGVDASDDVKYNKWLAKGDKTQFIKNETNYFLKLLNVFVKTDLIKIYRELLYKIDPKKHPIDYHKLLKIYKNDYHIQGGHMFPLSKRRQKFEWKMIRKSGKIADLEMIPRNKKGKSNNSNNIPYL